MSQATSDRFSDPAEAAESPSAAEVVSRLTRREKLRLISGADFWTTTGFPAFGVPSIMLADGPHGLRKQLGATDHIGLAASAPATCFPTASALGSTWDVALLEEIGAAVGREAQAEDVGVLLGPGLNIKRHPGGGRNFEYLSEDPLLSGRLAGALVRGVQSQGVSACVKHFAVNNQESNRMRLDAVVDERTLREVYLAAFEIAVREGRPWSVMTSYNKVNGEHVGESERLVSQILRKEWGFDGLVVTDWYATANRVAELRAGVDLEMPSSSGLWDPEIVAALDSGALAERTLDQACVRIVELAARVAQEREARGEVTADHDAHHALARRAAAAGTVLLTNKSVLPLAPHGTVALIGAFAEHPRYQGAGSSQVAPTRLDKGLDAMRERLDGTGHVAYAPGYDPVTGETSTRLIEQALSIGASADAVVVIVGLPARDESEGYDRKHLRLPSGHRRLVDELVAMRTDVTVVVVGGAPVEMPWAQDAGAVLVGYLGGQAGGSAMVDVLMGDVEPGGRLAESFPTHAEDVAAVIDLEDDPTQIVYREGMFVGYRFHDTFDVPARFAFGHGLGYTDFEVSELSVSGTGAERVASVRVRNSGERAGSTVVQLYVHDVESSVQRPEQELRAFEKVTLGPSEETTVHLPLDHRAFAVYDSAARGWKVESGVFELRVGLSSVDIRATSTVDVDSPDTVAPMPALTSARPTDAELARVLGHPVPRPPFRLPFHRDSTLGDLRLTVLGSLLHRVVVGAGVRRATQGGDNAEMMEAVMNDMTLRGLAMSSGGKLSLRTIDGLVRVLNVVSPLARRQHRSRR